MDASGTVTISPGIEDSVLGGNPSSLALHMAMHNAYLGSWIGRMEPLFATDLPGTTLSDPVFSVEGITPVIEACFSVRGAAVEPGEEEMALFLRSEFSRRGIFAVVRVSDLRAEPAGA